MAVELDFPNKYCNKVATAIMLNEDINKLIYYNKILDKDIFSLGKVKNPISELKDKNVFVNRRVVDMFKTVDGKIISESDVYVFVNLYTDSPCSIFNGNSRFINTLRVDIGVICNDAVSNTLNGKREVVIYNKIIKMLKEDEKLYGIGEPKFQDTKQNYQIPYGYKSYIITVLVDYFNNW